MKTFRPKGGIVSRDLAEMQKLANPPKRRVVKTGGGLPPKKTITAKTGGGLPPRKKLAIGTGGGLPASRRVPHNASTGGVMPPKKAGAPQHLRAERQFSGTSSKRTKMR